MPFLNQHSARLQDPNKFDKESFRRNNSPVFGKKLPNGVEVVWAKTKGSSAPADPIIPLAIRFPKDKYSVEQAKKWLSDNEIKYILFEPAKEVKESILQEIKDINNYIAAMDSDDELKENLRIVGTWYSILKTEGSFKYDADQLLHLSTNIVREMLERGKQKFHPENWKDSPKELYSMVFKGLYSQEVAIPENVNEFLKLKEARDFLNSPSFAYKAVYGKEPEDFMSGRTGAKEKLWKGIPVDINIKDEWLEVLNKICKIEIRASCEGHNPNYVAYIVFRLREDSPEKAKFVSDELNKIEGVYSKSDIGFENKNRIVVAGKTWYGKDDWEEWWNKLAERINTVVEKIKEVNLVENITKFILRYRWWGEESNPAKESTYELLIDLNKGYLDRWILSNKFNGNPLKEEASAIRKQMNIQTPNGGNFTEWLIWEGQIPPFDNDKLKGGVPYGNMNKDIPITINIKDRGDVEIIEDTPNLVSFKFSGKFLNGYYVMCRENNSWIFRKGKILNEENVKEDYYFSSTLTEASYNITESSFPIGLKYESSTYSLSSTKNGKLILIKTDF